MNLQTIRDIPLVIRLESTYQNLSPRDQLLTNILAIVLSIIFCLFGIVMPANGYLQEAEQRYRYNLDTLEWMKQNSAAVSAANEQSEARDTEQSLLGLANSSSKGFQLSFKRYEPAGDDGLSLWMEQVAFNNLVRWLERLEKRHGIIVQEISVENLEQSGLVNVRLVLQG